MIHALRDAVRHRLGKKVETIGLQKWFSRLSSRAEHVNEKEMIDIVRVSDNTEIDIQLDVVIINVLLSACYQTP
jgi:hypothetical protein